MLILDKSWPDEMQNASFSWFNLSEKRLSQTDVEVIAT